MTPPRSAVAAKHRLLIAPRMRRRLHGATERGQEGRHLGPRGLRFSFYANKIITTGEGGMVVTDSGSRRQARARLLKDLRALRRGDASGISKSASTTG